MWLRECILPQALKDELKLQNAPLGCKFKNKAGAIDWATPTVILDVESTLVSNDASKWFHNIPMGSPSSFLAFNIR